MAQDKMNDDSTREKWHRTFAVELFNRAWDLLEKKDRSPEDDVTMIHAAHASRHHWGEIGTPLELERGEWQISRVYSVLGIAPAALRHAELCLEICEDNGIGDFDLAFAYEALARAHAVAGTMDRARTYAEQGATAAEKIAAQDNRDYYLSELATVQAMLDR
jgi:hypothetical protein